ncbi:pyridoxal-phosphate dependent enzyme [Candidatus Bathyarchaeota archaeon]|nr:pyridoxal-phosphate dependent enzyme [Candidatus Bathyarchaeota archaeon]
MTLSAVEILKARKNLEGMLYRTPITYSKRLSEISGAEIYLKWESLQKTRSFKPRGAYNKICSLTPEERSKGVITASSGNHALAVALVAKMMSIKATVVVPENAPKVKVDRCKALGAEVVLKGANYDESLVYCKKMVSETGATYIPAFEDYKVIAGQGTIGCEILEEMPDTDAIIVPIGGGGLISGIALWVKTVNPKIRVVGAQSTAAYTMYECFKAKKIVDVPVPPTIADGLAGGISQMTLDLVLKYVDEIVLAEEKDLKSVILWVLKNERQVVEGSGIVGPAAIMQGKIRFKQGEKVVVVISGGNIDMELLNLPE